MGNSDSSSRQGSEPATSGKSSAALSSKQNGDSQTKSAKQLLSTSGIFKWLGKTKSSTGSNIDRNTDVTANNDSIGGGESLDNTDPPQNLQISTSDNKENNNTILSPQMAVQSKSSSSRSKAPAQPRSRFGLSSIARLANPLLRGEDDSEWGLNSGSFKSPSTPGGRSVGASGSQRVYRRKSKSTKHNILEEVTDHARAQLMTDIRNSKQAKRVSIRKLVTEPLASERVQFLNQASSSSSKSNNGGTIYLQESAKALTSCPETMMGYLCQREANKVLWKKYFVVLDSGTFSIFKLKKAPPVQPPYGDQVVKTMALKTYTVSLTDKSIKDDNGEVIPLKLYLKNNKSSGAKEDEEMVFRSLDSNTNDITLEEWADAFNAHILYDSQATKKKSSFLSLLE